MFMGVKSYHDLPSVSSYADAQRALTAFQNRKSRAKIVDQVNFHEDTGAIAFQLYATEVVTWYPDDSIDIDNYGTVTTSAFARHFLPAGIHLNHPTTRRGESGGANTISFLGRAEDGERTYAICQGSIVRFNPTPDGRWAPDVDTCYEITLPMGVDRKAAKQVMTDYHLGDFKLWLSMAPMHLDAAGERIEHLSWDLDSCMAALKARDFHLAAQYMPVIEDTGAYGNEPKPLPIETPYQKYVSLGCVDKLKLAIWDHEGLIITETRPAWDRKEYDRRMRQVKAMEKLSIHVGHLGART